MALDQPYPDLDELLATIGAAGQRLGGIDASEGAAGNISMVIGWPLEVRHRFPRGEPFELPLPVPALAGHLVIVTGSCLACGMLRLWVDGRLGCLSG